MTSDYDYILQLFNIYWIYCDDIYQIVYDVSHVVFFTFKPQILESYMQMIANESSQQIAVVAPKRTAMRILRIHLHVRSLNGNKW